MLTRDKLTIHALLMIGAFFMTFPFVWMVLTSLKDRREVLHSDIVVPHTRTYVTVDFGFVKRDIEVEVLKREENGWLVRHVAGASYGRKEVVPPERVITKKFHVENYKTAWNRGETGREVTFSTYMFNSFVTAILCTIGNVVTSLLAAYAFTFFIFPFKEFLFSILLITMMVPQQVLLVPDFLIVKDLGWYNTYWALFMPWIAGVFGIFLLRQFFMTLPKDLYEAAMIDGCSRLGFLFRILLPLSIPPIITMSISVFLTTWNSLIWPLTVVDKPEFYTIQVGLSFFTNEAGTRWELLMAASAISIAPLVILYFFAQKQFIEGIAQTGIKG